jgi:hypothetical protein
MSQLEEVCLALEGAVRPLPALVGSIQQRARHLRALAAEVQQAAGRVPNGPDCSRIVQGLYEAAASTEASGHALTAAIQQGRAFVQRTIGGGPASGVGHLGASGQSRDATWVPAGAPPGFAMVPLSLIDDSDSNVHRPEAFGKGYSPEDLAWAFGALHEVVLPAMAKGLGRDHFAELDQQCGYMGVHSYSDTYLGFFSLDDAITLDRTAGGYRVANGYHRLWVARRAGLHEVPAYIGG